MRWRGLVFGILMAPSVLAAQSICPAPASDADPLRIVEADLTLERYRQALSFLKDGLTEALKRHRTIADFQDDLSFGIQYTNSVRAVEGYLLKQRATYEGGTAVGELCDFLEKTHWSD